MLVVLFTAALMFSCVPVQESKAQWNVSFQVFYDELSPYGIWYQHHTYGYVWSPGIGTDFFPYGTGGYWRYTHHGWTWVSTYPWGWAPFHYGRWFFDERYGWVWVPGYDWAPAWVVWRSCDGYYGWTPWEPLIGDEIAFAPHYHTNHHYWRFIKRTMMGNDNIAQHYEGLGQYLNFLNRSEVVENKKSVAEHQSVFAAGPQKEEVEKITGKKVNTYIIQEKNSPGTNVEKEKIILYKPNFTEKENKEKITPAPKSTQVWKIEENRNPPAKKDIKVQPPTIPLEKIQDKPEIQRPIPRPKEIPVPGNKKTEIPLQKAPVIQPRKTSPVQKQSVPTDEQPRKPIIPKKMPPAPADSCC